MIGKKRFRAFYDLLPDSGSWVIALSIFAALFTINYFFVRLLNFAGTLWWQKTLSISAVGIFAWFPVLYFKRNNRKNYTFALVFLSLLLILGIGIAMGSGLHQRLAAFFWQGPERIFAVKLLFRLRFLIVFIFIGFILVLSGLVKPGELSKIFRPDRENSRFAFLLLLAVPLVVIAIFFPAFQEAYPRCKPWEIQEISGLSRASMAVMSEIAYAFDFITTEWVYRGLFVIILSRFLGKEAILPAAMLYAVMHFGKPAGEAISSLFGGYLLGMIAYRGGSIRTCILLHLGLAMSMEAAGLAFYYLHG